MKITKKIIEMAMRNAGFSYGYEYAKRKTIIVGQHSWRNALANLDASGISYAVVRVPHGCCTGEISFLMGKEDA